MLALVAKTAELKAQGRDLIGLAAGEPDFDTPEHIQEAARAAMRAGATRYTAAEGAIPVREAVLRKFKRENGLNYALEEIIVSAGAKQVIYNALMATIDAGDEVIIPVPAYPTYGEVTTLCGGVPTYVMCTQERGFKIVPQQLADAITPRTKWLVLCSPSNPTGAAYTEDELRLLAQVLEKHPHVWVMTDDIYEHLLFNGERFATMAAAAPHLQDRTLTVNGVSKAYCMTGWRIGYGGGPRSLIKSMITLQSQATSGPCSISQMAALAALDGPQDFLAKHQAIYRERRDRVVQALNAAEHISCNLPDGAFYALASCRDALGRITPDGYSIESDTAFCSYLLDEAGVVVVPGSVFGMAGFFRVSYAADTADLEHACQRINSATSKLK